MTNGMGREANVLRRRNLLQARAEPWQPPPLHPPRGLCGRLAHALRCLLDLQYQSILLDLRALLPGVHGTVLDAGCGGQPYRDLVAPGNRYLPIDFAGAGEHFGYQTPDTLYFDGDRWPVADAAVDLVLCTEVLEHIAEPARFLAEAARCLRPGGRLLLTVPFAARWHFIPHDYWRFTPSALGRLLAGAGFGEVAVYARGNALTVACYKGMALILPLLLPRRPSLFRSLALRLAALPLLPALGLLAVVGSLSLRGAGGNDCLGFTAVARRPPPA